MFFIYLLLWIIFNGRISLEIVITGAIISTFLCFFAYKFLEYSFIKEYRVIKKFGSILSFAFFMIAEVIKANYKVIFYILSPKYEVEPRMISFKSNLSTDILRTTLANAITITPGTITVSLDEDKYLVHCLDVDLSNLKESSAEKKLLRIEGKEIE